MFDYAFIVHSRNRSDLPRKFPWLSLLPTTLFDLATLYFPPFLVSKITGFVSEKGKPIEGALIGIPMTAHQLIENRSLALRRIIQAVILAKEKGAKYIGLGAMTASLSKGGKDIIDNIDDVYITTGRTFTVKNIINYVDYVVEKFKLDKNRIKIGIVGAAGGIGSGVAIALAKKEFKNFILIDLERKLQQLRDNIITLKNQSLELNILISHRVADIQSASIIISATSSPEIIIKSEDVNPGTIIINDAQPSDISSEIIKTRPDVLVIEGGVLNIPGINCHINLGLKNKDDVFSCLAEVLLLTYLDTKRHHSIDSFDHELYLKLGNLSENLNFRLSLQNDFWLIDERKEQEFAKILMKSK